LTELSIARMSQLTSSPVCGREQDRQGVLTSGGKLA
jgi:hypothetical protein